MNYWWHRNLSGIWTTCIWTYSPYLCTGILTAFFNFSFGFWIYSRSLSFCKHLVNLHYSYHLHQGLWVYCHHNLKFFSSQPHPPCSAQEGGICGTEVSQGCTIVELRQVGQASFGKKYVAYCQLVSQPSVSLQKRFLSQFPSTGFRLKQFTQFRNCWRNWQSSSPN